MTGTALIRDTGEHRWSNHHRGYTASVSGHFDAWNATEGDYLERYRITTRALQEWLGRALAARLRVRAYGSGWSLSQAPVTEGWMLNTRPLDLYFTVAETAVHAAYGKPASELLFLQCGNSITKLNALLRRSGRSLFATGASNGQTIAGALSTGTHGSAIDFGAISDYVVGLHILLGPERHIYLERASQPVLADSFAAQLEAELVRDDELFNAALVSFGSFGIIHGVTIETDELFLLDMYRQRYPYDDALRGTIDALDFSQYPLPERPARPFHFEVRINPYDVAGGVYVSSFYRKPYRGDYEPPLRGKFAPGDDTLAAIGAITDWVPGSIPLLSRLLELQFGEITTPKMGTLGEMFGDTATPRKAAGCAIGVPVEESTAAVDTILGTLLSATFPGLVALRFVPRTRATLGFTRYPRTCVIDVDGVMSRRTLAFYRRIWQALLDRGIPHSFHWGKLMPLDATLLRATYGDAVDRWLAARRQLLDPLARWQFSSPTTDALELSG